MVGPFEALLFGFPTAAIKTEHTLHHREFQPGASCAIACGTIPTGFCGGKLGLTGTRMLASNSFALTGRSLAPDCPGGLSQGKELQSQAGKQQQ